MRSIRRSLLGYFMLLLALAMGGMGLLVDRFANDAMKDREEAEAKRIDAAYKLRQQEAQQKFDAELISEGRALVKSAQMTLSLIPGINPTRGPGRPNEPRAKDADPPARPPESRPRDADSPNKATDSEVGEFRGRAAAMLFTPAGFWPSMMANWAAVNRNNSAAWSAFEAPRTVARLQIPDALRKSYLEDEDHAGFFQFQPVAYYPGLPGQSIGIVRPARVGRDLPFDLAALEKPGVEYYHDDVEIPGEGKCRRVVMGGNRPFGNVLPSPFQPPVPTSGFPIGPGPGFGPPRRWDFGVRVFVHYARPYSELEARLAEEQKNGEEQLAQVREETRRELTQLRTRLSLIGLGSFAALVLGGWFIVARGLAPIRKLSDAVSRVSEKDFRLSVERDELSHELLPILARLKHTLDSLRQAFAREKQSVGDISHELRTPIASILATIDVSLRKPRTPEQYRTTLEDCRGIARQLGQLVERIMTLATLDAGNARDSIVRTDAGEVARSCATIIRPLAEAHNLSFSLNAAGPLELDTDPDKLREVLMNLLHNAVEYNRTGGRVELVVERDGKHIAFEISDTGIGMPAEVREKIFGRFYRADASRHATGIHAGLGLAIVKEYVERLGGTIAVETTLDIGSTFRVMLPAAPVPLPLESDETSPTAERARPELRHRGEPTPAGS